MAVRALLHKKGPEFFRLHRGVWSVAPSSAGFHTQQSSGLRFLHRHMLVYSSVLDDVVDPTVKRSQAKLAEQERVRIREENRRMRAALDTDEASNLSVALPFIYGGAAFARQDAETVSPDEVMEAEAREAAEEEESSPPVYPFGLFPESLAGEFGTPRLAPGSEDQYVVEEGGGEGRRAGRGRRRRRRGRRRPEEGKEGGLEFDVLGDDLKREEARKLLSEDEMFRYGSANPLVPASLVPCGGCGAHLHCRDPKMPGFTPAEMFEGRSAAQLRYILCQRCYVMRQYNVVLKASVSPEDYPMTIRHVHTKRALVLLIVDLMDFPGSVWPGIVDLLGTQKKIILVGNKVDLLPQDSRDYLKRVEKSMKSVFLEKCNQGLITHEPDVVSSVLVSARTGFNIEKLINMIYASWRANHYYVGADIYLIGTTNVGKSSIFNALLESDLCKVHAIDKVERAMTSPVPGTTLNLLKFPVMRPDPVRMIERHRRLKQTLKVFSQQEEERLELLRKHKDRKYSVRRGPVELTFLHRPDKSMPLAGGTFALERRNPSTTLPQRLDPSHPDFADGKWCYDTPGTVCDDQLIGLLTQDEAAKMLPDLPVRPRSFALKCGQSLFIAGLARLDLLPGPPPNFAVHPVVSTVFCSDDLPINIVRTGEADEFYRKALSAGFLAVPSGSPVRLRDFPLLEPRELEVDGIDQRQASCDVVLSSAGWVTLVPGLGQLCRLRAWTPQGRGIYVRDPPFLPFAATLKGRRIVGTPAYHADKVYFPSR